MIHMGWQGKIIEHKKIAKSEQALKEMNSQEQRVNDITTNNTFEAVLSRWWALKTCPR